MSVTFKVYSQSGEVVMDQTGAGCYGALGSNDYWTSRHRQDPLSKVVYYPFVENGHGGVVNERCRNRKLFWEHLFTIPFVQEAMVEIPRVSRDKQCRSLEFHVRADIPADQMMNVLTLLRWPISNYQSVRTFRALLDMDVDPKVAFAISVGLINSTSRHEGLPLLENAYRSEYSFVDGICLGEEDFLNLITKLYAEDWKDTYPGYQDNYSTTGIYRRGSAAQGEEVRLTRYAAPRICRITDRNKPFVKQVIDLVSEQGVAWGRGFSSLRNSTLALTPEKMVQVVNLVEEKLHA